MRMIKFSFTEYKMAFKLLSLFCFSRGKARNSTGRLEVLKSIAPVFIFLHPSWSGRPRCGSQDCCYLPYSIHFSDHEFMPFFCSRSRWRSKKVRNDTQLDHVLVRYRSIIYCYVENICHTGKSFYYSSCIHFFYSSEKERH